MRLLPILVLSLAVQAQVAVKGPISVKGPIAVTTAAGAPYSPPMGWSQIANTNFNTVVALETNFPGVDGNWSGSNSKFLTDDWCGGWITPQRLYIQWCGGHTTAYRNEFYALDLNRAVPKIARLNDPTAKPLEVTARGCLTAPMTVPPNPAPVTQTPGGNETCGECTLGSACRPNSVHSYERSYYDWTLGKFFFFQGYYAGTAGTDNLAWWELDMSNMSVDQSPISSAATQWTRYFPTFPTQRKYNVAQDRRTGRVFFMSGIELYEIDPVARTFTFRKNVSTLDGSQTLVVYSPASGDHFLYQIGVNFYQKWNLSDGSYTYTNLSSHTSCDPVRTAISPGVTYNTVRDSIIAHVESTASVYELDPATDDCTLLTTTGTAPTPTTNIINNGDFGRWAYVEGGDYIVYHHTGGENVYTLKCGTTKGSACQ